MTEETEKRFVIDSWAWIEYFDGTDAGSRVKEYVENKDNIIFTTNVSLAEIVSKFLRRHHDPQDAINGIDTLSNVLSLDYETAIFAGELHAEIKSHIKDFGLADAFTLATARKQKAKIITGDSHFKGFPEAIMI